MALLPRTANAWIASLVFAQCLLRALYLRASVKLHLRGDTPTFKVPGKLIAEDLVAIVRAHSKIQIGMGYRADGSYEMTWQRPLLVMLGNHYSLDADALNESEFAHLPMADAVLRSLHACTVSIFLIPLNDDPFSMRSLYFLAGAPAPAELFPTAFRKEFLNHYRKSSSSRYFDLWSCTS